MWSIAAYSLTVATIILFREYFDLPYLPSISFRVEDGWCSPTTEGVGNHCFGDFQDIYSKDPLSPWDWIAPFSHPPLSHMVQQAFGFLGTFSGSKRLALGLWLTFSAAVLLVPAAWAMRDGTRIQKAAIFVVLGLGSLPVLVTLDRANSVFLLVGLSFGMAWSISRNYLAWAVSFAVCASLIRPQAIFLAMAFLAIGRARLFFLSLALSGVGLVLSFVIYPGDRLGNFLQWTKNLTSYQDYSSVFNDQVPNLSALRAIVYLENQVTSLAWRSLPIDGPTSSAPPASILAGFSHLSLVYSGTMALIVLLAGLLMHRRRQQLSLPTLLLIPSLLILLVPQTSFIYYASLLLVPYAFMSRSSGFRVPHTTFILGLRSGIARTLLVITSVLAVVAFVPLFIPSSLVLGLEVVPSVSIGAQLIGPVALLTLVMILLALMWGDQPSASPKTMEQP